MSQALQGNLAYPQTKIDLFNEINFKLTKEEVNEAVSLSGYTKKDKLELTDEIKDNRLTNTGKMWQSALSGVWKTMIGVDGWQLPGTFDKYNICGKGFYKKCQEHDFVRGFVYHCGRIGCEVCAKRAGARLARKIERRIWLYGLKTTYETKGRKNPLPSHIIEAIDPKSVFWTWKKQKQTDTLKKIRKRVGISGGAEINHLWAFDKNDSQLKSFYRPHKHLIAYGWLKSDAKEIIKKEFGIDMVYHKVRNGTLKSRVDVFAVAYYQLSHAAVKHNKHSVRWFGSLSYRKVSNKELAKFKDEEYLKQDEDIEKTKRCDLCYEKLIPARINKKFEGWREWFPPDEDLTKGCEVDRGLFLSVDFINGEKIPYYEPDTYAELYKLKKVELIELKHERRPDLYCKTTKNQKITISLNSEISSEPSLVMGSLDMRNNDSEIERKPSDV